MASNFPASNTKQTSLHPILKVIFQGVMDEDSPFSLFHGIPHIIKVIWSHVTSYWKKYIKEGDACTLGWKKYIEYKEGDACTLGYAEIKFIDEKKLCVDLLKRLHITFPDPRNVKINMMPFIMSRNWAKARLPGNLQLYFNNVIKKCIPIDEIGKIGYLTIHEGIVEENTSQRRPGIHTEAPGVVLIGGCEVEIKVAETLYYQPVGLEIQVFKGGIYMASSVEDSCEVWNCQILRPEDGTDVVGEHGDIEHLREFLPKSEMMKKDTVYWITDRTPHESLPLKKQAYQQFFRLVTSKVSLWYADHSTENPRGVVPDKNITKIVKGSKFDKKGVVLCE